MSDEDKKYYEVWAKHEIRVCYRVPVELVSKKLEQSRAEGNRDWWIADGHLLDILCDKDIFEEEQVVKQSWQHPTFGFNEHYLNKTGIIVKVESADGDPSPTLNPRMRADWDIGYPEYPTEDPDPDPDPET